MRVSSFMSTVTLATAVMTGTALVSNSASAETILYDNLSATSSGTDFASNIGPLYDSFSTGSSAIYFDSLGLLLSASNPSDGGTFTVSGWSDNSNSPGALLIGSSPPLSDSLLSTSLSVLYLGTGNLLAANSRYWIELSSTGSVQWSFSSDLTGVGVANEYYDNSFGGVAPNNPCATQNNPCGPYQMEVIGSVSGTPLPASWIMMLTGLAGFGLFSAYRRRKNSSAAFAAA
jgi:hypothetical protein